jgi:hypothetical protein
VPATRTKYREVPAYPEPYTRKKRKRGRPKKVGRPKKDRWQEIRSSPSKRTGSRFKSLSVSEETYQRLREISLFYKLSISKMIASLVEPAFDKAYQESLTLQRIEANRQKDKDETQDRDDTARRTHF